VGLKADITMQGCIPNAEGMKGSKAEVMVMSQGKVTDVDQNAITLFLMYLMSKSTLKQEPFTKYGKLLHFLYILSISAIVIFFSE
jgi:hypothetical protein